MAKKNNDLQDKVDLDEFLVHLNKILRKVRRVAIGQRGVQPLHHAAFAMNHLIQQVGNDGVIYSRLLRKYARLIDDIASGYQDCEDTHPHEPCPGARLVFEQLTIPVMLSISCAAVGLELKRGKEMVLAGLEDEDDA